MACLQRSCYHGPGLGGILDHRRVFLQRKVRGNQLQNRVRKEKAKVKTITLTFPCGGSAFNGSRQQCLACSRYMVLCR